MSWASSEVVGILTFLLPGFVATTVFYSLTSYPTPGMSDRVIHALVFTVVGQAISGLLLSFADLEIVGEHSDRMRNYEMVSAISVTVALSLLVVCLSNNDYLHSIFRRIGITKETSYPTEWYSAFSQLGDCYVVLHLKGERRLYGWPEEWPSSADRGHFIISEGEWLIGDDRRPVSGVSHTLIPAHEVEMVEFLGMEIEDASDIKR